MYRLLIVDNDPDACESAKHLLDWRAYGFVSVMSATSYAEAVSRAVDMQPHVALIDVCLGDKWGFDLAAQLRQSGMKTVFCMTAGSDDPYYMRKSMKAGAQDYLLKPLDAKELQDFVERVIVNDLGGTLPSGNPARQELDPVLGLPYSRFSKVTNKILLYTRNNYGSSISLTGIADLFTMSSKYIGRVFMKDTGIRFSEYLRSFRMLEARRLIINTQDKVSVIAGAVGYTQLNNFYTHFRNYFGVSPGALRRFNGSDQTAEPYGTMPGRNQI